MDCAKVVVNGIIFNNYTVSTDGKIYSLLYKKYLRYACYSGYHAVPLACNGKSKRCYVHRLVAEAYIPNSNNLPEVNHKDGNKGNNNVNNLEWVTRSQQMKHACDTGLRKTYMRPVIQYDMSGKKLMEYKSAQAASDATLIPRVDINAVCRGKNTSCKNYRFCYKDDENKGKPWDRNRGVNQIDPKNGSIIEKYDTVRDAASCAGVASNFMVKCCNKPDFVFNGYLWRYQDDTTPINPNICDFNAEKYPRIKVDGKEVDGYFVCPDGKIWSEKQSKYLKPSKCGAYDSLTITHNGKQLSIRCHRETAKAYLPNIINDAVVNHKDGVKRNNNVVNLEWCTHEQNTQHAHDMGLIDVYTKPVVKFDLNGKKLCEYDSIRDAAEDVGVSHTSIAAALSNNTKSSGGFIWRYKGDEKNVAPRAPDIKRNRAVIKYSFAGKKIMEYISVKDAAEDIGVNYTSIVKACTSKKSCGGFMWGYKDNVMQKTSKLEENHSFTPSDVHFSNVKAIVKFDLDGNRLKEYPSIKEAANAHNTNSLNISRACRHELDNFGGFIWTFKEEDDFILINTIYRPSNSKEVVKFDLNGNKIEEYYSAKEAAESNGTTISRITDACNGKSKSSGEFIWRYKGDESDVEPVKDNKLKPVVKFDFNCKKLAEYNSVKEAAKDTNILASNISAACCGKVESSGKFL
jgi:hypothetical protein